MLSLLRYALPALLLLYFVGRSTRQRIFLLGVLFLMFQNQAVFFDKIKLFWVPSRLTPADLMMVWLVIVWAFFFDLFLPTRLRADQKPRIFGPAVASAEEVVLLGLAALAALELVLTVLRFGALSPALTEAKAFIYLFVGYFLLRGMLCRAGRKDTIDLLTSLVVVNTIAAGLFFLHQGLHLPIYAGVIEYAKIAFMGQQLTRSFYFMPQLFALSLAFCFAKPRWGVFWAAVAMVNLAAVWVSYTRVLLVVVVAEFVVVLGVRLLKAHQAGRAVGRIVTIVALLVVLGAVAFTALPTQSRYFVSRITSTQQAGGITTDADLQSRFRKLGRVYAAIGSESHILGQGYAAAGQEATAGDISWMSADVVWVPVLYRLGLLGVAALVLLYGLALWRALRLSRGGSGDEEFLALVILGTLVGQLLGGMTSWTILDPYRYPMGLWLFALLAAEVIRRRAGGDVAEPAPGNEASIVS